MAELPNGQRPAIMRQYPHFLIEDNAVWTRALDHYMKEIEELWYDIRVGQPVIPTEGSPEFLYRVAEGVTRKRIDVVARMHGILWIIEIKPYGNMTAIGQALTYVRLFRKEYPNEQHLQGLIVCDVMDEDLPPLLRDLGISWYMTGYMGDGP